MPCEQSHQLINSYPWWSLCLLVLLIPVQTYVPIPNLSHTNSHQQTVIPVNFGSQPQPMFIYRRRQRNHVESAFQGNCTSTTNICSQICVDIGPRVFECDCFVGYHLTSNGYFCQSDIPTPITLNPPNHLNLPIAQTEQIKVKFGLNVLLPNHTTKIDTNPKFLGIKRRHRHGMWMQFKQPGPEFLSYRLRRIRKIKTYTTQSSSSITFIKQIMQIDTNTKFRFGTEKI